MASGVIIISSDDEEKSSGMANTKPNNPEVKISRRLSKLQYALTTVNKRIKQLEEAEVSSDEDEALNPYVLLSKAQKRAVQIYNEMCEIQDARNDAGRPYLRKVHFSGQGNYPVIGNALACKFNKDRKFPDYQSVRKIVKKLHKEGEIDCPEDEINRIAEKSFVQFGTALKRERCRDDYSCIMEYIGDNEVDPATHNEALRAELEKNNLLQTPEEMVADEFVAIQLLASGIETPSKLEEVSEDGSDSESSSATNESDYESDESTETVTDFEDFNEDKRSSELNEKIEAHGELENVCVDKNDNAVIIKVYSEQTSVIELSSDENESEAGVADPIKIESVKRMAEGNINGSHGDKRRKIGEPPD